MGDFDQKSENQNDDKKVDIKATLMSLQMGTELAIN